jgi:FtsP/CotA-like multicopper oxidase with cupredoxin domain
LLAYGGTFWMHSHEGLEEQQLLLAPLIIRDQRDRPDQQEIVLMLNDFSFTPPEEIFANLKKGSSMPVTAEGRLKGGGAKPMPASMKDKGDMKDMAGVAQSEAPERSDLNDVTYDAFLANDRTLADPEVVKVEPGRRVLLRVINGSAMSAYHFDLGRLDGPGTRLFRVPVARHLDVGKLMRRPRSCTQGRRPKLKIQAARCVAPPNWSSVTPNKSVPRNPAPKPMQE